MKGKIGHLDINLNSSQTLTN